MDGKTIQKEDYTKVRITFPVEKDDPQSKSRAKVGVDYFISKSYQDLCIPKTGLDIKNAIGGTLTFESTWLGRAPEDIQMFQHKLEEWAEMHFDCFITPENMKRQIEEVTVYATMAHPWKNINSKECLTFSYIMTWMLAMDNWFDKTQNQNTSPVEDVIKRKTLLKVMERMLRPKGEEMSQIEDDLNLDFKVDEESYIQILESISDLKGRLKKLHPHLRFDQLQSEILRIVQCFLWSSHIKQPKVMYNPGTYRYWRLLDYSGNVFTEFLGMILGIQLHPQDRNHILISRLVEIVAEIGYQANDLFGHRWDSEENTGEGYLKYLIGRGLSQYEAMKSLEATLQENVDDYMSLRNTVLELFGEKDQVKKLVDMLDNWIFGCFLILAISPKYGMVGEANFTFIS